MKVPTPISYNQSPISPRSFHFKNPPKPVPFFRRFSATVSQKFRRSFFAIPILQPLLSCYSVLKFFSIPTFKGLNSSEPPVTRTMSLAPELNSQAKPDSETRKILGPGGNRVRVFVEEKKKKELLKKKLASDSPVPSKKVVYNIPNGDDGSAAKNVNSKKKVKDSSDLIKGAVKVVPDGGETLALSPQVSGPVKRCEWITPNSETIYIAFHDGEWGVPVKDGRKLFELLVLSQALAELTWPIILS